MYHGADLDAEHSNRIFTMFAECEAHLESVSLVF
jgi:hypothetical protein